MLSLRTTATLALAIAAGTHTHAQTFTFDNGCGDTNWNTLCSGGPGQWRNNWGRSGPNPSLPYPTLADTVLLAGTVTLSGNGQAAAITNPAGTTFNYNSGSLQAASFASSGSINITTGSNKFFTGSIVTAAGTANTNSAGAFYLNPDANPASFTNGGTMTMSANSSFRRNGGSTATALFTNSGTLAVAGAPGEAADLSALTLTGGSSGLFTTAADNTLTVSSCALSGTLTGDFDGTAQFNGATTLATNTTLNTLPTSDGWHWTSGTIHTAALTLTNQGWLRVSSGANKFLNGTLTNTPAGHLWVQDGALYFNPESSTAVINNSGTLSFYPNGSIRRNGGSRATTTLNHTGTIRSTSTNALLSDIWLVGNGQWTTDAGASITLDNLDLSGTHTGNHAGDARLTGTHNLTANTTLATTGPNPWHWASGVINTGPYTLSVPGRLDIDTGANKFFVGRIATAASGDIAVTQGTCFFSPSGGSAAILEVTPSASLTFKGGRLNRNGGAVADARVINNGTLAVPSLGSLPPFNEGSISNSSVSGNGLYTTALNTRLEFAGVNIQGTFTGNHDGTTDLTNATLTGDTTFTLAPTSTNPWRFTSGVLDAQTFTATNAARLDFATGANKFIVGRFTTTPGSLTRLTEGSLYLSPPVAGQTLLTNNGTLRLSLNTSISRNGGTEINAILQNNSLIDLAGVSAGINSITLINGPAGIIRVDAGKTLDVPSNFTLNNGRLEGAGRVTAGNLLINAGGTLAPGDGNTPGEMLLPQRYTQQAGGTLEVTLTSNGLVQTCDRATLTQSGFTGEGVLGGTLRVTLPAGASTPVVTREHVVLTAPGGLTGAFSQVVTDTTIPNVRYTVRYTPTEAILKVIKRCSGSDIGGTGADTNFDGALDNNDFIVFIDYFFAQNPIADVGTTGGVSGADAVFDNNDFIVYIDIFFNGCN